MSIFTPINQVKLTNVSIVRLKRSGKRFEVACYKNKALEWRSGLESDLDNVLQVAEVFVNVSKGQVANKADLLKAFGTDDSSKIIQEILKKGELQINEKERTEHLHQTTKEIAAIIADKTINPTTNRPYPITMIEKAMTDLHVSLNPNKSAKQQALEIIKGLQTKGLIPIKRAEMRLQVRLPSKEGKRLKDRIHDLVGKVEEEDWSEDYELVCLVEPGNYRKMVDLISNETKGKGTVDVVNLKETQEGDELL